MADEDKKLAWSSFQFGTIVGLLILILVLNFSNLFSKAETPTTQQTVERLEEVVDSLRQLNQESKAILAANKENTKEFAEYIARAKKQSDNTYEEMLSDYEAEMDGMFDPVLSNPGPHALSSE